MTRRHQSVAIVLALGAALLAAAGGAPAAEIHSNGLGGGDWSDPATWHGSKVPVAADTVVIASRDQVDYDGSDKGEVTCTGLAIDPDGVLTFKGGNARRVLVVAGRIDNFGAIRVDATRSPLGAFEIRLASAAEEERTIVLREKSSLLLYGADGLADDQRNITVCVAPGRGGHGEIRAGKEAMVDLQRLSFVNVAVIAGGIDNTGYTANERLNIVGCRFAGAAHVTLNSCDSPRVVGNTFQYGDARRLNGGAVRLVRTALAEVRGNHVLGGFEAGLDTRVDHDSSFTDNVVENCTVGIQLINSTNAMVNHSTVRSCDLAVNCAAASAAVDRLTVEKCKLALHLDQSAVQLTTLDAKLEADAKPIRVVSGRVTLLNCGLKPEQVEFTSPTADADTWARSLQYLVVGFKGRLQPGTRVEVRTADLPVEAADPNVRNSPASILSNNFTPIPRTQRAIVVQSWKVEKKKPVPAPKYVVTVWESTPDGKAAPTIRAKQELTPDESLARPEPDAPKPNLEITLP